MLKTQKLGVRLCWRGAVLEITTAGPRYLLTLLQITNCLIISECGGTTNIGLTHVSKWQHKKHFQVVQSIEPTNLFLYFIKKIYLVAVLSMMLSS